ncbi:MULTISPECIES: MIP/aquaporin family protein [Microbacterium]|uniref:MIP/aquaporin family protein n=1 Tax=Microbacterium TaxID=33882 RepID=UPI001656DE85|nr:MULTISPECIES: MIP/aquaporin family protein [Microbacterium]MCT1363402.1 aquaporin family protein [Microbacterium sp. p3-SID131]MCT1376305.1 aquaporin family protein [Microbacterium sp. p3-SID337]MCZ0708771.1 aquaporin family protein [Microbacterium paraoxydans]MDH5133572.1 aquaporin family protein [Microbacterium sp. RD10]MDH5138086.1 aquaporin family protein [Microbacterium sp. RD11]
MTDVNLGLYFLSELVGTAMLVLLGCGVVANVALAKNKGFGGGFLMVNWGWGLAVFAGVLVSAYSGAILNPAVGIGLWVQNLLDPAKGIDFTMFLTATGAELLGAIIGAIVVWLAYKQHFDQEPEAANKLGVFSTGPAIRSYGWNLVTEIIGTFVLVFVIFAFADYGDIEVGTPGGLGPLTALPVALLVVAIGASLGGPTGYAINPARDLGPRIAHAILPIQGKGSSDWSYSWVPVVGPLIGGVIAALAAPGLLSLAG